MDNIQKEEKSRAELLNGKWKGMVMGAKIVGYAIMPLCTSVHQMEI
jgi:hypothetical protein